MKPLQEFYSFPVYASREDYEAKTGKVAAPWNPDRPLKLWADENPTDTAYDELNGEEATYRPVLSVQANGTLRNGPDGQPVTGSMRLNVEIAKTYNFLPAKGVFPLRGEQWHGITITAAHIANAQRTIQVPLTLPEGAKVVYAPGIGSVPVVLLRGESLPGVAQGGFTDADRLLIQKIAQKLGVS